MKNHIYPTEHRTNTILRVLGPFNLCSICLKPPKDLELTDGRKKEFVCRDCREKKVNANQ